MKFVIFNIANSKNSQFSYPLIKIKGGLTHLQEYIVQEILEGLKANQQLIVIKRYSLDIERYINSIEEIDKKYTYAAVELELEEANFEFVPKVEEVGEFARVGDVISFWPIGYPNPVRIEFFDEKIEKIVIYDELYSSEIAEVDKVLVGDVEIIDDQVEKENILVSNIKYLVHSKAKTVSLGLLANFEFMPLDMDTLVLVFGREDLKAQEEIDLQLEYPVCTYSNQEALQQEIKRLKEKNFSIIFDTRRKQAISEEVRQKVKLQDLNLPAGLVDKKNKTAIFTDRELFGTIFITQEKKKTLSSKKARKLLDQIEGEVEIEDYIVHEDHGIGIYQGMKREDSQEYISIGYANEDELLVPLNQIHKITKYIGVSNQPPEITSLNKIRWKEKLQKVRKTVQILARDLVKHYARINVSEAQKIDIKNTDPYEQFVQDFKYEETEDQLRTIDQIMRDLSNNKPMNRLIVGDVGFGKTEVAMRAAFKVVQEGLQVAVLCPTTVLAAQHYKVFTERFKKFGIEVVMLSRFTGEKKNSQILRLLANARCSGQAAKGKYIDIIIGTHRLLSNDVKFKKLGLVIIDEEQKFGVKQKEKIKKLKYGSHTLTMTATPIPRTLSMALSEIQDISIISTPPKNRRPVKTFVEKKDWNKVQDSIKKEVERGGQVYFVHNRVQSINSVKVKLENLLPGIKFVLGHGQMDEKTLEKNINDFYNRKYDCLICTTIIENGIDMPNVNTIIIDNAQNFGLGQLYQLRGRVGRSEKQAFAYLFYKGDLSKKQAASSKQPKKDHDAERKTQDVERKYVQRLKAIMESQDLGSGFKIASRDLEIRGAGNLLGREQHGKISQIGLALYMQMLAEEIEKLTS